MVKFYKMHSLGNDFMVLDAVTHESVISTAMIKGWAQRHEGIGFDQLLVIAPQKQPDADFHYIIYMLMAAKPSSVATAPAALHGWRSIWALATAIAGTARRHVADKTTSSLSHRDRNPLPVPSLTPVTSPLLPIAKQYCCFRS